MAEASELIADLAARGATVAVAESLTGGLLTAELIGPAGASAVVRGAVVAYSTQLKSTLLGVDARLLSEQGPVHPDVATAMARNVRDRCAVDGRAASIGISTTGVAGPDAQGGIPPGVVYLGLSVGKARFAGQVRSAGKALSVGAELPVRRLDLPGSRQEVRAGAVRAALDWLAEVLEAGLPDVPG